VLCCSYNDILGPQNIDAAQLIANNEDGKSDWCRIVFVIIPYLLPLILFSLFWSNFVLDDFQKFISAIMFILLTAMIITIILLIINTNEDSISGMVAQRYNLYSYLTILEIMAISFYTSCFITCGAISRTLIGKANHSWSVIFASLSPIISSLILVFPVVVFQTVDELHMIPLGQYNSHRAHLVTIDDIPHHNDLIQIKFFKNCTPRFHKWMHFIMIGTGLLLGFSSMIYYVKNADYSEYHSLLIALTSISGVICIVFFIAGLYAEFNKASRGFKMFRLYVEFVGLYYYMLTLILISAKAGDIMYNFN